MTKRQSSKSTKSNANTADPIVPIYMYVTLLVLTQGGEWKRHQDTVSDLKAIRNAYLPTDRIDCSKVKAMLDESPGVKIEMPLSREGVANLVAKLDAVPVTSLDEAARLLKAKARIERMVAYKSAVPAVSKVVLRAGYAIK